MGLLGARGGSKAICTGSFFGDVASGRRFGKQGPGWAVAIGGHCAKPSDFIGGGSVTRPCALGEVVHNKVLRQEGGGCCFTNRPVTTWSLKTGGGGGGVRTGGILSGRTGFGRLHWPSQGARGANMGVPLKAKKISKRGDLPVQKDARYCKYPAPTLLLPSGGGPRDVHSVGRKLRACWG